MIGPEEPPLPEDLFDDDLEEYDDLEHQILDDILLDIQDPYFN